MRRILFAASVAAIAIAMPASAKPGNGKGGAHPAGHSTAAPGGHTSTHGNMHQGTRYGAHSCPPGLAAKNNGCLPPGQAKKLFDVGQRIPAGYGYYTPYGNIPVAYRDRYGLVNDGRYIYRDNSIYVVDRRTSLVTRIIDLID